MREVTRRTGLTPDLLRAWEKRYRVVKPRRSAGGQRLYSDEDIERLAQLHRAVLDGRSIGQVAHLDRAALARLTVKKSLGNRSKNPAPPPSEQQEIGRLRYAALAAAEQLDTTELERVLSHAAHQFSVSVLLDDLVAPLLREIGDRWESGTLRPVHEHAASVEVNRLLLRLLRQLPPRPSAPTVAVTTPAGQLMELGALMVGVTAAAEGWRVAWLGPNLPAADIVLAARSLRPAAVAISLVHQTRDAELARELEHLARGLEDVAPLLVGGRAARTHGLLLQRLGAVVLDDLPSLRAWLRSSS